MFVLYSTIASRNEVPNKTTERYTTTILSRFLISQTSELRRILKHSIADTPAKLPDNIDRFVELVRIT